MKGDKDKKGRGDSVNKSIEGKESRPNEDRSKRTKEDDENSSKK